MGLDQEEKWGYDTYVWLGGNDNNLTYFNQKDFKETDKLTAPAYFVKYDPQRTKDGSGSYAIKTEESICQANTTMCYVKQDFTITGMQAVGGGIAFIFSFCAIVALICCI